MNVLLVLAHPERRSFNGALFDTAVKALARGGHEIVTSDLYRMGFNPVSDRHNFRTVKDSEYLKLQAEEMYATANVGFVEELEVEIRKLESCDLLVLQFPLWWFALPAILKGWFDRVLVMGRTYGQGALYEKGKFRGKRALLCLTTGGPEDAYLMAGLHGDIHAILRPIQRGVLEFVGFDVLAPQIHFGAARVNTEQREKWLVQYAERLRAIQSEKPIVVGKY